MSIKLIRVNELGFEKNGVVNIWDMSWYYRGKDKYCFLLVI